MFSIFYNYCQQPRALRWARLAQSARCAKCAADVQSAFAHFAHRPAATRGLGKSTP